MAGDGNVRWITVVGISSSVWGLNGGCVWGGLGQRLPPFSNVVFDASRFDQHLFQNKIYIQSRMLFGILKKR
jgi:hypothetical protein